MLFESFAGQTSQHLWLISEAACPSPFVARFQDLGGDGVLLFRRHVLTIPHPSQLRPHGCSRPPAVGSRPSLELRLNSPTLRPFPRHRDYSPRFGTSRRAT